MHTYATDSPKRTKTIAGLGIMSAGLVIGFSSLFRGLPVEVLIPSPFALFGVLYWLMDNHAWRWPLVQRLGIVKVPDLSGDWTGTLRSSFDDHATAHPVRINIKQTWSRLCVRFRANDSGGSGSHSIAATLLTEGPQGVTLVYVYKNEPDAEAIYLMHPHDGTASLSLRDDGALAGSYYSGRGRGNHGSITLSRVAKPANPRLHADEGL